MEELYTFVPFSKLPRIHMSGLIEYLLSLRDEVSDECYGSDLVPTEKESHYIAIGEIVTGGIPIRLELYNISLPKDLVSYSVQVGHITPTESSAILTHSCFIRCATAMAPIISPIEAMIAHLKIGMGLCAQGGLAYIGEINSVCVPERILRAYARTARSGPQPIGFADLDLIDDQDEQNLWDSLRYEGYPGDLLTGILPMEISGKIWCFTAGQSFFGFPELAYRNASTDDFERIEEHFRNIFSHMIQSGMPVKADATLECGLAEYRFSSLPSEAKELEGPTGTLLLEIKE
jgi:hypothetical protein